ncbi:MAG: hypothetical protein J1E02_03450 [Coprobacter sp.]|nr:hypothetical protein [Coprobacter sp.]
MNYTDEMKEDLEREISSLQDIKNLKWDPSKSTESKYLKFKKGEERFKVRISSHTTSSLKNEVLFPAYYNYKNGFWVIDACLGKYKPKDVKQLVENICNKLLKYNNEERRQKIKKFAEEKGFNPIIDDDALDLSFSLAERYINERNLKDDKYGSTFQVLKYIGVDVLNDIIDEERYMIDL